MLMGVRLEYGDEEAGRIIELGQRAAAAEFGLHPYFAFPWLKYIPIPGLDPVKDFNRAVNDMYSYFKVSNWTLEAVSSGDDN